MNRFFQLTERGATWTAGTIALSLAALLVPVLLVHLPPLVDYHNHWARIWLIAGGIREAPLDSMYALDWRAAWTNIGIDLIALLLGPSIGADRLAPALLGLAIVLPPLGAVLLNRAVFGGWHWWQIGFAVFAWTATLAFGHINFRISLGLALIAAAADRRIARMPTAAMFLLRGAFAAALIALHIFGAAFYAVLLAGLALGPRLPRTDRTQALLRAAVATLAVGAVLAAFMLLVPTTPIHRTEAGVYDLLGGYSPLTKALTLLSAIITYDGITDLMFVAGLWAAVHALPVLLRTDGALGMHAGLLIAATGLALLAILSPQDLAGTALVDIRFSAMAILTLLAALRPELTTRRAAVIVAAALLCISLARTAWITGIWREREADAQSVQRALATVPAGATILPVARPLPSTLRSNHGRSVLGISTATYLPAHGVRWRHSFIPILFAVPGRQPLRVLAPWDSIAVPEGIPGLVEFLHIPPSQQRDRYLAGYMRCWRQRFDVLLLMRADATGAEAEPPLPMGLVLLADEGFARLYRIERGGADPGC